MPRSTASFAPAAAAPHVPVSAAPASRVADYLSAPPVKLRVLADEPGGGGDGCPLYGKRGLPLPAITPPDECPMHERYGETTDILEDVGKLGYTVQWAASDRISGPGWTKKAGVIRLFYRPGRKVADCGKIFPSIRRHFNLARAAALPLLALFLCHP